MMRRSGQSLKKGLRVNVSVDVLDPCKRLVRFELEAAEVDKVVAEVEKEYLRQVVLPGFRKGKAPREIVFKSYGKEIEEQAKRRAVSDTYSKGLKEKNIEPIGEPEIDEIDFGRGKPLRFIARLEVSPEFEVPEYRGLPARREMVGVSEADVDRAIESLRMQMAKFDKVERPAQEHDVVVVNYTATCDGKPLAEVAPSATSLNERKGFWIEIEPQAFIPGFAPQLAGARAGERRTVQIDFAADFVTPELRGKHGVFEVEVTEVRQRVLPELNDEFARSWEAENVVELRQGVRRDLQGELNQKVKRSIRNQLVHELVRRVNFDLPDSVVQRETRNVVYEVVSANQRRGVSKERIEQHKDQIYSEAAQSARERLKVGFLFHRIAEKEGIRPTREEINARIITLATANEMPADKFMRELEKRNGLPDIIQQLIHEKVLDFLHEHARIEDLPPGQGGIPV